MFSPPIPRYTLYCLYLIFSLYNHPLVLFSPARLRLPPPQRHVLTFFFSSPPTLLIFDYPPSLFAHRLSQKGSFSRPCTSPAFVDRDSLSPDFVLGFIASLKACTPSFHPKPNLLLSPQSSLYLPQISPRSSSLPDSSLDRKSQRSLLAPPGSFEPFGGPSWWSRLDVGLRKLVYRPTVYQLPRN